MPSGRSNLIDVADMPPWIGGGRFAIDVSRAIGSGGNGSVFAGYDGKFDNRKVAVKVAKYGTAQQAQLKMEKQVYLECGEKPGFPEVFWLGEDEELEHSYLVVEQMGLSLHDLFRKQKQRKTTEKGGVFRHFTIFMIFDQAISRLQSLHEMGFIHRDIKPSNFLIGRGKRAKMLYLIDFGLTMTYMEKKEENSKEYEHIKPSVAPNGKLCFLGTAKFMSSIHAHMGFTQSRRDDMLSLGCMMLFLAKGGKLPWDDVGMHENASSKREAVFKKKNTMFVEDLCHGLPPPFHEYFKYVKLLRFKEEPDYDRMRGFFTDFLRAQNPGFVKYDFECLDWYEEESNKSEN